MTIKYKHLLYMYNCMWLHIKEQMAKKYKMFLCFDNFMVLITCLFFQ